MDLVDRGRKGERDVSMTQQAETAVQERAPDTLKADSHTEKRAD